MIINGNTPFKDHLKITIILVRVILYFYDGNHCSSKSGTSTQPIVEPLIHIVFDELKPSSGWAFNPDHGCLTSVIDQDMVNPFDWALPHEYLFYWWDLRCLSVNVAYVLEDNRNDTKSMVNCKTSTKRSMKSDTVVVCFRSHEISAAMKNSFEAIKLNLVP